MKYSEETRNTVNKEFENLETVSSIAKKYGIPWKTVYRWKDEYLSHYKDGETTNLHKIQYLQKRVDRLSRELEIYKRCKATSLSPLLGLIDVMMLGNCDLRFSDIFAVHNPALFEKWTNQDQ